MNFLLRATTFLVMIFCSWALTSSSQSYYFKHYQAEDGLAHNSVTSIFQDSRGLMWIGTRGGLNRFDGYSFKIYRNKKNKFGNVGNNVIRDLAEDKNGMLWVGTGKGVFMFDPVKEVFTALEGAAQAYINDLVIDDENNLWFSANSSLYKYDQKKKELRDFGIVASCLAIDTRMNLWIGNNEGIISVYGIRNKSMTRIELFDNLTPRHLRSISEIYPVNENEILIGCFKQGLKSYNRKTGAIINLTLGSSDHSDMYVRDIAKGEQDEYWVGTESGIYIYNLKSNSIRNLRKKPGDPYSLADNAVYTLCRDSQGGLWAGTFFGGVSYYSKENARFNKFYPVHSENSLSGEVVREICSDNKGNLWIGTEDGGINKFNPVTQLFTNYKANGMKGAISYPNIHGLLALDNQLFIGPFLHGMEIMDMRTGLITNRFRLIGNGEDQTSDFVLSIYLTRDSTLLVGTAYTGSGLFKYDRRKKTFTRISQIPFNSYVFAITEDSKGNIWTGSVSQGAFYYNPKTGRYGNLRFGDKVKDKIINEFAVYGIFEDSNHALWFTTEGGGLIRLSPDRRTIKKFNIQTGLPTNILFRILEDDTGHLWISSLKGLICLNMRTYDFKVYTKANGLITDQFNFNSAYKDNNGKMYFGSVKGLIAFNPKEFRQTDIKPLTYITGFQINDKEITPDLPNGPLKKSILYTDSIVLAYNQNNFSIEFAALNYSSPEVTRYEFQMQGLDKSSTYLSKNRKAYFTDLSPGEYTFILKAKSNVGSWIGNERKLHIRILPPFWKSEIAYVIYILILSLSLFWAIRYYHRNLERKNLQKLRLFEHEKEKEIYQAKIQFFTNIAHEIQTPLTLILGPVELMVNDADEESEMKENLLMVEKHAQRLSELTGQLLDFRKTETHQFGLNFVNTNINKLLKEQVVAFQKEAEKSRIFLQLELPDYDIIAFADKEALVKITSNLISNALKYAGSASKIQLEAIGPDSSHFSIQFWNDGKGIPDDYREQIFEPFFRVESQDKPGTGIGLSLAKSLTELHSGTLKLLSGETDNVIFELTLPIHQKFEFNLSSWKNKN
ncbi:ligand-binding sensor domain-containing protein [Desertivirga arenae]|uniref:ligand-binding sensor domain-containing protein n=1 Tax=Desertivirga arenae TaxID=2810309 RepID=UPI001F6099CA|nr:sensor histidine kinase [Pedobacter sp. SYSU D00823]